MSNPEIKIYIHVCCINNWEDVLKHLLFTIKDSGLYNYVSQINCGILGNYNNSSIFTDEPKINIIYNELNTQYYEVLTLNHLHKTSCESNENFYVLYFHTKGVKHIDNPNLYKNVKDWVDFMLYFNVYHHKKCIEVLKTYDAVGVNLNKSIKDNVPSHYSGNFWWSKSDYIKKLGPVVYYNYNAPEFWLTEKELGNFYCLWYSNVNHYHESYEKDNYIISSPLPSLSSSPTPP